VDTSEWFRTAPSAFNCRDSSFTSVYRKKKLGWCRTIGRSGLLDAGLSNFYCTYKLLWNTLDSDIEILSIVFHSNL